MVAKSTQFWMCVGIPCAEDILCELSGRSQNTAHSVAVSGNLLAVMCMFYEKYVISFICHLLEDWIFFFMNIYEVSNEILS